MNSVRLFRDRIIQSVVPPLFFAECEPAAPRQPQLSQGRHPAQTAPTTGQEPVRHRTAFVRASAATYTRSLLRQSVRLALVVFYTLRSGWKGIRHRTSVEEIKC